MKHKYYKRSAVISASGIIPQSFGIHTRDLSGNQAQLYKDIKIYCETQISKTK